MTILLFAGLVHAQHGHPQPGHGAARGHGAIPGPAPGPAEIDVPEKGATLPMLDFGGRPVVEIKINGKGPYRFILDTGASINVIDAALNQELNLPLAESVATAATGGSHATLIVSVQEIRIGDAAIRGVIGAVMPFSNLVGAGGPRGVLSAANFPGYLLTFDYPAKRISIAKGSLERADSQSIFEYSASDALPKVPIQVAGHKTRLHVDTGSPLSLTLPTSFLKTLPLASDPKAAGKARTHSGEYPISRAAVNGPVELGQHKLEVGEIQFSDIRPGWSGPAIGQIGCAAMRSFVVTLDTRNRRIRFAR